MANYVKQLSHFYQRLKTGTEVLIGLRKKDARAFE